ncbi:MAG: class I SAM-dependent methyltransferase [Acidimicrobiales bacterium]
MDDHEYWDEFYGAHNAVGYPSPFAEFCESHFLDDTSHILELGPGNGRDTFYFYDHGHQVTAVDQSEAAVEQCRHRAAEVRYANRVQFRCADFTRLDPVDYPDIDAVYSRFTLHSIDREAEGRVLEFAWNALRPQGQLLIEARTINDPLYGKGTEVGEHEFITDHYRRHLDAQEFLTRVLDQGFQLHFFHESNGLAVFQDEDPVVVRVAMIRP